MNHATNQQTNHSGTAGQADPTNGNSTSISSAQLIDARALWWREAEPCDHTESDPDWDECDCVTYPHWAFGNGWMGFTAPLIDPTNGGQTQYLTDRHLLIREDRLSGWPGIDDPSAPYLGDLSVVDRTVQYLTALLTAAETGNPVTRRFDPALLEPLRAAGCELRVLAHDTGVHAVVDAAGNRIGLLMPLNDEPPAAGMATQVSEPITSDRPGECGHCGEPFDRGARVVAAITESSAQRIWCLQEHTTVPANVTRPDESGRAGASW